VSREHTGYRAIIHPPASLDIPDLEQPVALDNAALVDDSHHEAPVGDSDVGGDHCVKPLGGLAQGDFEVVFARGEYAVLIRVRVSPWEGLRCAFRAEGKLLAASPGFP
jgi:hypothetical protein